MRKAYILYLWLALFTMFISFFSIILFNYLGSDIKITRKLVKDTQYYSIIKSVVIVATENYRVGRYTGDYNFKGYNFSFSARRISPTRLLVDISENDQMTAKVIVQDKLLLSDINVYFVKKSEGTTTLSSNTTYSNFVTTADSISITADQKIFDRAFIDPQTTVNGQGVEEKRDKDKKYYIFHNLEELKKYANYAGFVRSDLDQFLINSYTSIRDFLRSKSVSSRTFPDLTLDLTKYGSIYIADKVNQKEVQSVRIKFYPNDRNQQIFFDVFYRGSYGWGSSNGVDRYNYYLINQPTTIDIIPANTVTNDQNLQTYIDSLLNPPPGSQPVNPNSPYPFELRPENGYVYKVLLVYGQGGNLERSIVYKTANDKTMIFSDVNVEIGSDNPNTFNSGIINNPVLLVTSQNINILGHIVYQEFGSIENFVNFAENNSFNFPADSKGSFYAIAKNITVNSVSFTSNDYLILNGHFVAFYDQDSTMSITNKYVKKLYYFGTNIAYSRYNPYNEKVITDYREGDNIFNAQFSTCRVLGIYFLK